MDFIDKAKRLAEKHGFVFKAGAEQCQVLRRNSARITVYRMGAQITVRRDVVSPTGISYRNVNYGEEMSVDAAFDWLLQQKVVHVGDTSIVEIKSTEFKTPEVMAEAIAAAVFKGNETRKTYLIDDEFTRRAIKILKIPTGYRHLVKHSLPGIITVIGSILGNKFTKSLGRMPIKAWSLAQAEVSISGDGPLENPGTKPTVTINAYVVVEVTEGGWTHAAVRNKKLALDLDTGVFYHLGKPVHIYGAEEHIKNIKEFITNGREEK